MPTVPVYNQRVAPAGANTPYVNAPAATPAAFGALTGQALENVGQGVTTLGKDVTAYLDTVNKENNQRTIQQKYTVAAQQRSLVLNGDGTADNPGILNLKGNDAMAAWPVAQKQLDAIKAAGLEGVTNTKVRDGFTAAWDTTTQPHIDNALQHVYQQRNVANTEARKGVVDTAVQDAAANPYDTRIIDHSSIMISEAVAQQAASDGLDTATMKDKVVQAQSAMFEKVIKAAAVASTKQAINLFTTYEDRMDGVTKAVVTDFLEKKQKQDVIDRNAFETSNHTATLRYQEDNYNKLGAAVFGGTVTEQDLGVAAQHGIINQPQLENLLNFKKGRLEHGGDADEENTAYVKVMMGNSSYDEIMTNPKLDATQKHTLLGNLQTVETQGPVFGRYDIKKAYQGVADAAGGQRDVFGKYTAPEDRANERNSLEAFDTMIRNVDQTKTPLTPELVNEIRDKVIVAYSNQNLPASALITHLPQSKYIPYTMGNRSGEEWTATWNKAKADLNKDHENSTISDDEFNRQAEILKSYKLTIDRIVKK